MAVLDENGLATVWDKIKDNFIHSASNWTALNVSTQSGSGGLVGYSIYLQDGKGNNDDSFSLLFGQNISMSASTNKLTISATDTTYDIFSDSANGLVPKSYSSEIPSVLAQDGWRLWDVMDPLALEYGYSAATGDDESDKVITLSLNMDSSPTSGSTNAVSSGGVYSALAAQKYTLPVATSSILGGVKIGTGLSITNAGVLSNSGVRSISTGGTNGTISVNTNGSSTNVAVKGLGSAAYTASTAYATAGHTHSYAGSSSAGGAATSANKLNTNAGDDSSPVYFANGVPVACSGIATKDYVQTQITGSAMFQGVLNTTSSSTDYTIKPAYTAGWYWIVGTAGKYVGQECEVGDTIFCTASKTASDVYSAADFNVLQVNWQTITTAQINTICTI